VHVALHRGQHDGAVVHFRLVDQSRVQALCDVLSFARRFHERDEVGDRLLHDTGALDDLRKEHLAGPEQVAHDGHAVHERPFDDVERLRVQLQVLARFLSVCDDKFVDSLDEAVRQTLLHVQRAPRVAHDNLFGGRAHALGELEQLFGPLGVFVPQEAFAKLEQLDIDV